MAFNYNNKIPNDILNNVRLEMTCPACPEQYDMFFNNRNVGYFRLRHGSYTVCEQFDPIKNAGSIPPDIYEAYPEGDGEFMDNEREFFLTMGIIAVLRHIGKINVDGKIPTSMKKESEYPFHDGKPIITFN